ncbi:pachytene checkpoint protein 2 homolog [Babylonia areolata]|uniref:pachytene checkpoint protein 2 homolog n=1 Tax=Babylonia areolata TaxID=304850 RepID=UPI003FD6206C
MMMNGVCELAQALPCAETAVYHIEVLKKPLSVIGDSVIKDRVGQLIHRHKCVYGDFTITEFDDQLLSDNVLSVSLSDSDHLILDRKGVDLSQAQVQLHVYTLNEEEAGTEELDEEQVSMASQWMLPSAHFHGHWESLVFDEAIKERLLNYATTTLLFSDKKVNSSIISWNRVILLHGPPGTGKTTLCKALSHKLCIRLSHRFTCGQLVEINSHSLFSKWFSESGKLVTKMFQRLHDYMVDPQLLVCVLIDEVESLTAARKSCLNGNEPSDAIRVVNAVLTQIDQLKKFPNCLILTTSNITGAIDLAFVDRADIKQYIGPPTPPAIYKIYLSCLNELMRVGIIHPAQQLLELRALEVMRFVENNATRPSLQLRDIAMKSEGLSGRTLRKLPFMAHAMFIQGPTATVELFLHCLSRAVDQQFQDQAHLST